MASPPTPSPLSPPRPSGPSPVRTIRSPDHLASLLRDLGPRIQRGSQGLSEDRRRRHPCGLAALDALLDGGFPSGRLCEIAGPPCSGRTSIALSLLARTTAGAGELAALIDLADAFDPISAREAGVDLERLLWVRIDPQGVGRRVREGRAHGRRQRQREPAGRGWKQAFRCAERVVQTEGIPVVLLDLVPSDGASPDIPPAAWIRLARSTHGSSASLVVLTGRCQAGGQAEIALELEQPRARFSGGTAPPLLEDLEVRARLVRHRTGATGLSTRLDLRSGGVLGSG